MKRTCLISLLFMVLVSCSEKGESTSRIKKELSGIATDYARSQINGAKVTTDADGTIRIGNEKVKYVIDPSHIVTGFINDDAAEDAVISMEFFDGRFLVRTESLFLMNVNGKFEISLIDESIMRAIEIKDRIIYAEVSKVGTDSPTYGCPLCIRVVRYRFENNKLNSAD
jgi:hypothetical protein